MKLAEALEQSYKTLSPFSDSQQWEFNSNLVHLKFLVRHLKKEDKILDHGCGIGILSLALKFLGYDVVGEDKFVFSPDNAYSVKDIDLLKRIWQDNKLIIYNDGIFSDQFDALISVAVIEHQKFPRLFMENLLSRIKTNGLIYIATPNVVNLLNRFRFLLGRAPLGNLADFYLQAEGFIGHWREYTLKEVKQICELAGMRIVEADNVQCQRSDFRINKWKKWHRNLFRMLACLIPGGRDSNIMICRK